MNRTERLKEKRIKNNIHLMSLIWMMNNVDIIFRRWLTNGREIITSGAPSKAIQDVLQPWESDSRKCFAAD